MIRSDTTGHFAWLSVKFETTIRYYWLEIRETVQVTHKNGMECRTRGIRTGADQIVRDSTRPTPTGSFVQSKCATPAAAPYPEASISSKRGTNLEISARRSGTNSHVEPSNTGNQHGEDEAGGELAIAPSKHASEV
jgi:hypothetical protein